MAQGKWYNEPDKQGIYISEILRMLDGTSLRSDIRSQRVEIEGKRFSGRRGINATWFDGRAIKDWVEKCR